MKRIDNIKRKLAVLKPHYLEVIDESHLHVGHIGNSGLPETHFAIKISAGLFKGMSLIDQHKILNQLLKDEFENGLHALSIKIGEKNE